MPGQERTPEERAAAAAERMRRRGMVPPPQPPPADDFFEPAPAPAPRPTRVSREPRAAPPPRPEPGDPRPAPPLRGGGRARRRELPPAMRRTSYTGRRIVALIVVLIVGSVVWAGVKTFQPFHGDPTGAVRVNIAPGSSVGDIAKALEARGIIASPTFFSLNATLTGRRGDLRPGNYTLGRDMSYGAVLDALSRGPHVKAIKTFKLTLPEGLSVKEIARRVSDDVEGDYAEAAQGPAALRTANALGLPSDAKTTEGFLFPATYDFPQGGTAEDLVSDQLKAFDANFESVDLRRAKSKNLTRYDIVIIASMVEREAQIARERPLVAAVIYNRLREGMVLGIDATTRYEYDRWDKPLLQSQLNADTPYNTRLNRNLPPTPIGNPGLASLKAAAHPAKVPYLYYVVRPCGNGRHNFSSTDAQFQRDVAAYNAKREELGGRSPVDC